MQAVALLFLPIPAQAGPQFFDTKTTKRPEQRRSPEILNLVFFVSLVSFVFQWGLSAPVALAPARAGKWGVA
jgi:hypothetical protein